MEFKTLIRPLQESQYYKALYKKKYIFLHHTVSGSAQSAVDWWNTKPDHVATPFIIERSGAIIETFEPKYWSYALGLKGGTEIEKASIHIEIVSWGQVHQMGDKFFFIAGKNNVEIPKSEVVTFKNFYREWYFYHAYTQEQISSLRELILYLVKEFKIQVQPRLSNFWYYNKELLPNLPNGIWSHSTVRPDKSDIMPQKELVEMIYGLKFP
jgi:N-acetyl-anhydromuramyl-L-alanine amidase AmpD